jgi:hypothetical protein
MLSEKYRMFDTKKGDGCYISFERQEMHDDEASPTEYLFQDPDYKAQDEERLAEWRRGNWHFIGIRAVAHISIIRDGHGTMCQLESPGVWAIESDSGEDFLKEVFEDECNVLKDMIGALQNPTYR